MADGKLNKKFANLIHYLNFSDGSICIRLEEN